MKLSKKSFEKLVETAQAFADEGKNALARRVVTEFVQKLGSREQYREAQQTVFGKSVEQTTDGRRIIDTKAHFQKYGTEGPAAEQQKKIVAGVAQSSEPADKETSAPDPANEPDENAEMVDDDPDVYVWENAATDGAIELISQYPELDTSSLDGKKRITKRDIQNLIKDQGLD